MDCMLFTFKISCAHALKGVSGVNSFINDEADIFPMQAMLPEDFPFFSN